MSAFINHPAFKSYTFMNESGRNMSIAMLGILQKRYNLSDDFYSILHVTLQNMLSGNKLFEVLPISHNLLISVEATEILKKPAFELNIYNSYENGIRKNFNLLYFLREYTKEELKEIEEEETLRMKKEQTKIKRMDLHILFHMAIQNEISMETFNWFMENTKP